MTTKVKKSSQHRGDTVSDLIKALLQLDPKVSFIQPRLTNRSAHPIDGVITFPLVDPNRILQPHRDVLILMLGISDFDFSVVANLSPFNAILGRAYLHGMKVTPSTYHQMARCLEGTLQQNKDVFAWTHFDIPEIHPLIASHQLNILPSSRRIRQKVRWFHPDRQRIIQDEIDKLLATEFIKEVEYPDWLANVVVVPKKGGKCFPLPWIDQIVDSTVEHGMLSFLDAFSGYHQIPMSPADEEKTVFITPHKLYCYKVMPFGLKNAGATYQRLMTKIFKPLIGHIVEVYIDDIMVKNKTTDEHD
uniref:Reverse transcriptase domain-containing protein n=1 Tax=Vitis vinifera TaxID=29760 RepID=A5BFW5_VITVI|nr:hypothetical protein VITISV_013114 [Vitis vinifera]